MAPRDKRSAPLPSWAKLVPPRFKKTSRKPLSVAEEESFARTRSYHELSRQIDRAMEDSLRTLSVPIHKELDNLIQQGNASHESKSTESLHFNRTRLDSQDDASATTDPLNELIAAYTVEPCQQYNPLLLPILVLEGPSYRLDRHEWMNHLVTSTKKMRPRSCTVWLCPNPGLTISLPEELTRQCLMQESNLPAMLKKKRFMEKASLTDTLLLWAQTTTTFDNIIVFCEIEDDFYSSTLQDFIKWTADRRAVHGLPFILVLLGPHARRRPLDLRSSAQGSVGVWVRHATLPSSRILLNVFWERLWVQQQFPIAFSSAILEQLYRVYREQNESAIHVAMKLKLAMAHALCAKWSFLLTAKAMPDERDRIDWFLASKEARKLLPGGPKSRSTLQEQMILSETRRRRGCIAIQLIHCLHGLVLQEASCPVLFLSALNPSILNSKIETEERTQILSLLAGMQRQIVSQGDDENAQSQETIDIINRLVILCDSCETYLDVYQCVRQFAQDWTEQSLDFSSGAAFFSSSALGALQVQPRRHSMKGLVEVSPNPSRPPGLVTTVGNMYRLIHDRVAILRSEWFELFRQTFAINQSLQDARATFAYGVYHLKLCGLLREKRLNNGNDCRYEKALLVWCSGD